MPKPLRLNEQGQIILTDRSVRNSHASKLNISGVYMIFNLLNEKSYIGSAINIRKRITQHKSRLRNNKHDNRYLQKAWLKYKEINFIFVKLEDTSIQNLIDREQFWINSLKPEYNIRLIAKNNLGFKFSKETKDILSKQKLGKPRSEETKQKLREANLGKKQSIETALKRSAAMKGRKLSEEHKAKLRKPKSYKNEIQNISKQ